MAYADAGAACQQAATRHQRRLGSLSASSFFTRSLPGGICDFTLPARDGGHKMKGTRPSMSARGTCNTLDRLAMASNNCWMPSRTALYVNAALSSDSLLRACADIVLHTGMPALNVKQCIDASSEPYWAKSAFGVCTHVGIVSLHPAVALHSIHGMIAQLPQI